MSWRHATKVFTYKTHQCRLYSTRVFAAEQVFYVAECSLSVLYYTLQNAVLYLCSICFLYKALTFKLTIAVTEMQCSKKEDKKFVSEMRAVVQSSFEYSLKYWRPTSVHF